MALSEEEKRVLEHVALYRLTIPPAVGRRIVGNTREGRALLERLADARRLFRHRQRGAVYYSASEKPLSAAELREAFGILWFCSMGEKGRELIPEKRVREIAKKAVSLVGAARLEHARCYLEPTAISLLRVSPEPPAGKSLDLERVLSSLQRFVATAAFRPWLVFAAQKQFLLTYLIPGEEAAAELGRWLSLHPLVGPGISKSPLGEKAIVVPARVSALELLRGA